MSNWKHVVSSNIKAAAYDPDSRVLRVKFKSGAIYKYENIDTDLWSKFEKEFDGQDGRSAGSFFHRNIRHLPNEKVEV